MGFWSSSVTSDDVNGLNDVKRHGLAFPIGSTVLYLGLEWIVTRTWRRFWDGGWQYVCMLLLDRINDHGLHDRVDVPIEALALVSVVCTPGATNARRNNGANRGANYDQAVEEGAVVLVADEN